VRTTCTIPTSSAIGTYAFDVLVDGPDTLDIIPGSIGTWAGNVVHVSAYWKPSVGAPSGITIPSDWGAISQTWATADKAHSTYVLRWLARQANWLMNDRARHAAAISLASSYVGLVPQWAVRIASRVPSVTAKVYAKSATTQTLYLRGFLDLSAGGAATPDWETSVSITTTDWAWYSMTLSPGASAARDVLLRLAQHTDTTIGSVLIYENAPTASNLGLPGAETIPAAFVDLDESSIASRKPILASTLDSLVKNMVWLASAKVRTLVCESTNVRTGAVDPLKGTMGIYRVRATPDGWTKQIRCIGSYLLDPDPDTTTNQYLAWAQWAADNGGASEWKELEQEQPFEATTVNPLAVNRCRATYTQADDHSLSSGSEFIFRRLWGNPDADAAPEWNYGSGDAVGAVFEELPDGTTTTSWP
jgi:hypothetical protein